MKKNKKHKWKYRVNIKKKILVLIILGVSLFVGLGYAILESNLNIFGTLEVSKYDKTLYSALKREVNKGYAKKYEGDHQDSMDQSKSTEDIYHFYADTKAKGTEILNKNNVVFANSCWQMIRTTDTGGVRLLYNGEPEITEEDGETHYNCGDTRNLYHMGEIESTYILSGNKKYGKNYTATTSGTTTTFTLVDDPDDPDDTYTVNITASNAATEIAYIAENYPYTCGNTTGTCTNQSFYKVVSQSSEYTANVYKSIYRDAIGLSSFNTQYNSPTYVGYMYGDIYTYQSNLVGTTTQYFITTATQPMLSSTSFAAEYMYAKTVTFAGNAYALVNPILGSNIPEDTYVGYYTHRSSSIGGPTPDYIVGKNGTTGTNYYYVVVLPNKPLADFSIMVGTDLIDNGDNTYTIKNGTNQATEVTPSDWYSNYASYKNMYTCGNTSDTCTNPRYITATTITNYTYIQNAQEKFTIAKTRNSLDISDDYVTISKVDWYNGYNTIYADYVYTCGNTDTVCTESNLRYITAKTATGYTYAPNHYFGSSVIYEDNKYKLQNTIPLENSTNMTNLSTHHYTCVTPGETECAQVAYVYYYTGSGNMHYITLNDPNITSAQDALDAMFTKNTTSSTIKTNIDKWYEMNLLNTTFESKLDDTIYCNDRSYPTTGNTFASSGWNDNGGALNKYLYFKESRPTKDLSCTNVTDRFSVSNNDAHLTYKIALLSVPEINLLNQSNARKPAYYYWLASPNNFGYLNGANEFNVNTSGGFYFDPVGNTYGVRPAVSLVTGTEYSSGNGEMTNPYIVKMDE